MRDLKNVGHIAEERTIPRKPMYEKSLNSRKLISVEDETQSQILHTTHHCDSLNKMSSRDDFKISEFISNLYIDAPQDYELH